MRVCIHRGRRREGSHIHTPCVCHCDCVPLYKCVEKATLHNHESQPQRSPKCDFSAHPLPLSSVMKAHYVVVALNKPLQHWLRVPFLPGPSVRAPTRRHFPRLAPGGLRRYVCLIASSSDISTHEVLVSESRGRGEASPACNALCIEF